MFVARQIRSGSVQRSVRSSVPVLKRHFGRGAPSNVTVIQSHEEYEKFVNGQDSSKAVVYFTAKWCGPCKMISPIYDELSMKHTSISFAKVDVDDLDETAHSCGIRSMPTFHFHADGQLIPEFQFSGADASMLSEGVEKLLEY